MDDIKALKEALSRLRTEVNPATVTPEMTAQIVSDSRSVAGWMSHHGLSVLLDRLEAAERDAARYEWLRARVFGVRDKRGVEEFSVPPPRPTMATIMRGSVAQHFDAAIDGAIDAAMKKEPQQ
jgi:hypothetical protein